VLSRAESGERALAIEEVRQLAAAIGTPEATRFLEAIGRTWSVMPAPPPTHPDLDVLWRAEGVATQLRERMSDAATPAPFLRRLEAYMEELTRSAARVSRRDHLIAFIGPIGVGKSTAICRVADLEVPTSDREASASVLEAGAGGITICEVHALQGPGYGIRVEPCADDEVRAHVADFAEQVWRAAGRSEGAPEGDDAELEGVSKEIERAIRNMSGLSNRKIKGPDGKFIRKDDARELARASASIREFVVEILARMQLHRRDRRDAWHDAQSGRPALEWLKETFERINNGRHPDFSLPRRIEVLVPRPILDGTDVTVGIVDTKGMDRTAARADIEKHLNEPHTIAVLCSMFNDSPGTHPRTLLQRAVATGVRGLSDRVVLLVLPRGGEALAMKDDAGVRVSDDGEGYELKSEQVALALQPLRAGSIESHFYNAHKDNPSALRDFLIGRIASLRRTYATDLEKLCAEVEGVLANQEREQANEVFRDAARMLSVWLQQHEQVPVTSGHPADSLLEQLRGAHASTIRASVRRSGDWSNLDYAHNLGHGARAMAALALGPVVQSLSGVCQTMAATPDYAAASGMIDQANRALTAAYEEMLTRVELMGKTTLAAAARTDSDLWARCERESGRGYRQRVVLINDEWFKAEQRASLEAEIRSLVEREWGAALAQVRALLAVE
jgi:hypothetical protein